MANGKSMGPTPQGVQDPEPTQPTSAEAAIAAAPEPSAKGGKVVKTVWPTDKFVVEGLPVVTAAGTQMTAEQFKKVSEVAEKCKVQLREVND